MGSALAYAIYIVISHKVVAHTPPLQAAAIVCTAAGITLAIITTAQGHLVWPIPTFA